MNRLFFMFCLFCFSLHPLLAQDVKPLLTNVKIQFECTEAIDSLYNFKFDVAEQQFNWLRQQYPTHPLPYFLLGLSKWWHIMPNDEIEIYDKDFHAYMDTSISYAETLYEINPQNPEASFFLAAAHGFKARLQADREHYAQATFSTNQSLNYLNENKSLHNEFGPEFLFGTALYNYFRVWIPENKPFLKRLNSSFNSSFFSMPLCFFKNALASKFKFSKIVEIDSKLSYISTAFFSDSLITSHNCVIKFSYFIRYLFFVFIKFILFFLN